MGIIWILKRVSLVGSKNVILNPLILPRKAVGEMMPVRFAVRTATPESMKGTLKSTTASLSELIIREAKATSTLRLISSAMSPFHFPFWTVPHFASATLDNSYVKPMLVEKRVSKSMQNPEQHW